MLLILINPQSGLKKAPLVFKTNIRPLLNIDFEAYETAAPLHATELTKTHFEKYSTAKDIMILGGDGLVHEVIKGIYELRSIPQTIQLWIIPCGSGNALATSVGVYSPEDGISRFLKKEPLRKLLIFMDYCFCVISFGFHTQIIRQSEWLRFMGAFRFQLAALWNLLFFNTYKCEFKIDDSDCMIKNFQYFIATKVDYLDRGFRVCKTSDISSDQFDIVSFENVTRFQIANFLTVASRKDSASTYSLDYMNLKKSAGFTLKPCAAKRWMFWNEIEHDVCIDGEIFKIPDGSSVIVKPLGKNQQKTNGSWIDASSKYSGSTCSILLLMFNFWKKPQEKFSRLRKPLQREIEVLAAIIAIFIIAVPIVSVHNAQEGDRKASSVIDNYGDTPVTSTNFDGVMIQGYVSFVDPSNYQYRLNLRFFPSGNYSQGGVRNAVAFPMRFNINGKSEDTEAFSVISPRDFLYTFSAGSATEYPFEEYSDLLSIVATALVGNETVVVPIAFEYAAFLQGWDLNADILSPDLATYLEAETFFRRSRTTKFFSVFINILMWLLSLLLLAMVVGIWFRNRSVEPPTLAFNAALLFAVPAIRQVQPGIPTIGCIADAAGFFWCMAIVSVCLLALMTNYIVKYQAEPPKGVLTQKTLSEDSTSVLSETPVVVALGS